MAARTSGVAHIYACVLLEHPHTKTQGGLRFTTFDAFIRASNVDFVTCIFCHISLVSEVPVAARTYNIQAKVHFEFSFCDSDRGERLPRIGQHVYMCGTLSAVYGSCPQVVPDNLIILTP